MSESMVYIPIEISAAGYKRRDKPVEVELNFKQILRGLEVDLPLTEADLRLVEVRPDADDEIIEAAVPFQLDREAEAETSTLVFLLKGITPAKATRRFYLIIGDVHKAPNISPAIHLTDNVDYQEQESFKITTPSATYFYHKYGAGFASMIDQDGLDWLSYRPWGGSDGKYRGIPNLVYPEGFFHPGGTALTSQIVTQGPLKLKLFSETPDQKWVCAWEIYPAYARLTVLRIDHPYWFLYEGTPGGALNEANDYVVRSTGVRTPTSDRWAEPLPEPRWLYFGAGNISRVLYLIHHEVDGQIDSYWPMEENMTVFGFGRLKLESYLEKTPACFTIGFAGGDEGSATHANIVSTIDAAYRELHITIGKPTRAPQKQGASTFKGIVTTL